MVQRQVARGVMRSFAVVAIALSGAIASAGAQSDGNGFMFHAPAAGFSLRGGYELANATGQPFDIMKQQTTVGPRSFDAVSLGADLNWFATRRFDVVLSIDGSSRSRVAEYRDWEENGQPITHETHLDRVGLAAGVRYNLVDRGRSISALSWIPARTIPYVGVGAGMMWYDFVQKGDFVAVTDSSTADIFTDELRSSHQSLMALGYAGIEHRLNARASFLGEARYTAARAALVSDYQGLGNIQLSGLTLSLGVGFRF